MKKATATSTPTRKLAALTFNARLRFSRFADMVDRINPYSGDTSAGIHSLPVQPDV